jgi:hypothetical protein
LDPYPAQAAQEQQALRAQLGLQELTVQLAPQEQLA